MSKFNNIMNESSDVFNLFEEFKLEESINDRYLFKCLIMTGGPGAGKGFIVKTLMDDLMGIKITNSDAFFELGAFKKYTLGSPKERADNIEKITKIMKFKKDFEDKKIKVPTKFWMSKEMQDFRNGINVLVQSQMKNWLNGMLPIIVDGTGKNLNKVEGQRDFMLSLGYDVYMVFVNTAIEIAQKRNKERPRILEPELVGEIWNQIHQNTGKYQSIFGTNKFFIIDNTKDYQPPKGASIEVKTALAKQLEDFKKQNLEYGKQIFKSSLENPLGQKIIEHLKSTGGKYYSDLSNDFQVIDATFKQFPS